MASAAFNIAEVLTGFSWSGQTISYSFLDAKPDYAPPGYSQFERFDDSQKAATRAMLAEIQTYLNVRFVETPPGEIGQITFGMRSMSPQFNGETDFNLSTDNGGDAYLNVARYFNAGVTESFKAAVLHETLHALGILNHTTPPLGGPPSNDDQKVRFSAASDSVTGDLPAPTSLQLYDISALQQLYGAAPEKNQGNSVYSFGTGNFQQSIWDTGGRDVLSAEGSSVGAVVNLNATSFSSIGNFFGYSVDKPAKNVSIARNVEIEDAKGTQKTDIIIGNHLENKLEGFGGDDLIFGDEVAARNFFPKNGDSEIIRGLFIDDQFFADGKYRVAGTSNNDKDTILAGDGEDWVFAGTGDDEVDGGEKNDFLDGGAGNDIAKFADITGQIAIKLLAPSATPTGVSANGLGIYEVTFNRGATAEKDLLRDFEGIEFGDGTQRALVEGDLVVGKRSFFIDGGGNASGSKDVVDLSKFTDKLAFNGKELTGKGVSLELKNFEKFIGSSTSDQINLGQGSIREVQGGGGYDKITGNTSSSVLFGEEGNDTLIAGRSGDILDGGISNGAGDKYVGGAGADTFIIGNGVHVNRGTDNLFNIQNAGFNDKLVLRLANTKGSDIANLTKGIVLSGGTSVVNPNRPGDPNVVIAGFSNTVVSPVITSGGIGSDGAFVSDFTLSNVRPELGNFFAGYVWNKLNKTLDITINTAYGDFKVHIDGFRDGQLGIHFNTVQEPVSSLLIGDASAGIIQASWDMARTGLLTKIHQAQIVTIPSPGDILPGSFTPWTPQKPTSDLFGLFPVTQADATGAHFNPAQGANPTGAPPAPSSPPDRQPPFGDQHPNPLKHTDPLVVDLDGDGLSLTSVSSSHAFVDFNGDGFATRTGWVDSDDGILVDGRGSYSASAILGLATGDGFGELAAFDSNADGRIDEDDDGYFDLRVWIDANGDGTINPDSEVYFLDEVGIVAINLDAVEAPAEIDGNSVTHIATFERDDASVGQIAEVDFAVDPRQTRFVVPDDLEITDLAAVLPNLAGYGLVADLKYAMSLNETLEQSVYQLVETAATLSGTEFERTFEAIVQRWAGAESVDPNSRGPLINAQHMAVVEAFFGQTFEEVNGIGAILEAETASQIEAAYQSIVDALMVRFAAQYTIAAGTIGVSDEDIQGSPLSAFLSIDFDVVGDTIDVDLDSLVNVLAAQTPFEGPAAQAYIDTSARLLAALRVDLFEGDIDALVLAFEAAATSTSFTPGQIAQLSEELKSQSILDGEGQFSVIGTVSKDVLLASENGQTLSGGEGGDSYIYSQGDGSVVIDDASGSAGDKLILVDVDPSQVVFSASQDGLDVVVYLQTGETVLLKGQLDAGHQNVIETIVFSDGTVWTQSEIVQALTTAPVQTSAAVNLLSSRLIVSEAATAGAVVGTVKGVGLGDYTYSLIDNADGRFVIDAATGRISVAAAQVLDYESATTHEIAVRVTDQIGQTFDKSLTIALVDANEAPADIVLPNASVAENASAGTVVGTASGSDSDFGSILTYSLVDDAAGRFAIDASTGEIIVTGTEVLDYESAASHQIIVRLEDQNGLAVERTFQISLTDVDEGPPNRAPTDITLSSNSIQENASNGSIIGYVTGVDPDAGAVLRYSLLNNAGGRFVVDEATGAITIADGSLLDFESAVSHVVVARVTDQDGLSFDKEFSIAVTDVAGGNYTGTAGPDTLTGSQENDQISGGDGDDTIIGGRGDDVLRGEGGNDTYVIRAGDGNDVIIDSGSARIYFPDLSPSDVSYARPFDNGNELIISILPTGQTVRVLLASSSEGAGVLEFANNVTTSYAQAIGSATRLGTAGADSISGSSGADTIFGLGGADEIFAGDGNDTIRGGLGDDILRGDAGTDTFLYQTGDGNDRIIDFGSDNDRLVFSDINASDVEFRRYSTSASDLTINIMSTGGFIAVRDHFFSNQLFGLKQLQFANGTIFDRSQIFAATLAEGTAGADDISGTVGADTISALAGNDLVSAGDGNDTIRGGLGNDTLRGNAGADTYFYASGDGNDLIDDSGSAEDADKLVLTNINQADVKFTRTNNDLVVTVLSTSEAITVRDHFFSNNLSGLKLLQFADGTTWDRAQIFTATISEGTSGADDISGSGGADTIHGLAGNDTISAGDGNDTLSGGLGNDTLRGDAGADTYLYARGDGNDLIIDSGAASETDKLVLTDLNQADVRVTRGNDDLIVTILSTSETITVRVHFFSNNLFGLKQLQFASGPVLDRAGIAALVVTAGSTQDDSFITGDGPDTVYGFAGNDFISTAGGNDVISGGTGNDTLRSNGGSDTYLYALGDGTDYLDDESPSRIDVDVLRFSDLNASDISLTRSGVHSIITIKATGDRITLDEQFFNSDFWGIEKIEFANGTFWDRADIQRNSWIRGTSGNETLFDTGDSDTFFGGLGDDTFRSGGGSDTFIYAKGDGNDYIDENSGNNSEVDVLRLTNLNASDLTVSRSGSSVLLKINETGHVITLDEQLLSGSTNYGIDRIDFANSQMWGRTEIQQNAWFRGTSGNDSFSDTGGDDTFIGGLGNDTFRSGGGSDTYIYASGDGNDYIDEENPSTTAVDVLRFTDLNASDISLTRSGVHSVVTVNATGQTITLDEQFYNSDHWGIDRFEFANGQTWNRTDIQENSVFRGGSGNDSISATSLNDRLDGGAGNDTLSGQDGNDILVGGAGNDNLIGGAGRDSFVFKPGFGQDTVADFSLSTTTGDHLQFDTAVFADFNDVIAHTTQAGADTVIADGLGNTITLQNVNATQLTQDHLWFV